MNTSNNDQSNDQNSPPAPRRFEPPSSKVSEPFWEATREQRLVLQHCNDCERVIWYPRVLCQHCGSRSVEWRHVDQHVGGMATVYAISVQYNAAHPGLRDRVPYVVALVDLDIGIRMMTNIVGEAALTVAIGERVRPTWEPLTDGRHLLVYESVA